MKRAALLSIVLVVTLSCMSIRNNPTTCKLVDKKAQGQDPLVSVALTLNNNRRFVGVEMVNVSGRVLQLVLQEWSLSTPTETSHIVTTGIPNGRVHTIVLAPVTLPPGGKWVGDMTMRSHHHFDPKVDRYASHLSRDFSSNYSVSPIFPDTDTGCQASDKITLSYVIQDSAEKKFGSVAVSPHYQVVANPYYKR